MNTKIFLCSHHYFNIDWIILIPYLISHQFITLDDNVRIITSANHLLKKNNYFSPLMKLLNIDFIHTEANNKICSKKILDDLNNLDRLRLFIFYPSENISPGILGILQKSNHNKDIETFIVKLYIPNSPILRWESDSINVQFNQFLSVIPFIYDAEISIFKWEFEYNIITKQKFISSLTDILDI